jgi:hypothetical protein
VPTPLGDTTGAAQPSAVVIAIDYPRGTLPIRNAGRSTNGSQFWCKGQLAVTGIPDLKDTVLIHVQSKAPISGAW